MSKEIATVKTYTYAVYTREGCEVTDTATGMPLITAEPGKPNCFPAMGDSVTVSDDAAIVFKPVFKCALAAFGLLGEGDSLPAGYTRLEFLQDTGSQYLKTDVVPSNEIGILLDAQPQSDLDTIPMGCREKAATESRFYAIRPRRRRPDKNTLLNNGFGWGKWLVFNPENVPPSEVVREKTLLNWQNDRKAVTPYASENLSTLPFSPTRTMYIFAANVEGAASLFYNGRIWRVCVSQGERLIRNYVPALNPGGEPCMLDTRTGAELKNDGQGSFIAGVGTVGQLNTLLSRLASSPTRATSMLKLSLPAEANTPAVSDRLTATAAEKGWTLTVYEYRPAAAVTYSLRRVREVVWCRKLATELGGYVDASGRRWQVERCSAIFAPDGSDPTAYGYEPFDSADAAAEHWQLVPYEAPEEENLTNE